MEEFARETDLVSVVECSAYEPRLVAERIEESIISIGGLDFERGRSVMIKPNLLGPYQPDKGVTTHPAVVEGLVRYLRKEGVRIYLGESSGCGARGGTTRAFSVCGLKDVAERYCIEIVDFDCDEKVNVLLRNNDSRLGRHIRVSRRLFEADYIVNVPKLKTHELTGYTGAIKNMFGIIPGRGKTSAHSKGKKREEFSEILVDIYETFIPHLNVLDAIVGMEGRGPSHGRLIESGMIGVGFNGAALDYAVAGLIGFNPGEIDMIRIARERGLFNGVKIVGDDLREVKFERPSMKDGRMHSLFTSVLKPGFYADKRNCKKCYGCVRACPEGAIRVDDERGFPVWEKERCVTCYCCRELCQEGAVVMRKSLITKFVDFAVGRFED